MKIATKIPAVLAAALTMTLSLFTATAGPSTGALAVLRTVEQAKAVPPDKTAMMACGGCQTIQTVKPKGLLAWFTPDKKHECPGCGGKVTWVGAPGKSTSGTKFTHSCTMCGNASAYICAEH